MPERKTQFDVAVIGGGPAGAVTAREIARYGLTVAVTDRPKPPGEKVGETIPPSSRLLLERMGLLESFLEEQHLPCYANRSVWGSDQVEERNFITDPHGHGWHLDRDRFDRFLLDAAASAGVRLYSRTSVTHFERQSNGWLQTLQPLNAAEISIHARWVVDASGRASWFARRLGVTRRLDDRLVAFAGFTGPSLNDFEDTTTLVEAARDGWWYSALLRDKRLVVVYFTDSDLIERGDPRSAHNWRLRMRDAYETDARVTRHGGAVPQKIRVLSAGSACLESIAGDNWLAVGDAAVSYDPLSSCGIATAMASGIEAADAIRGSLGGADGAIEHYAARLHSAYARYAALHSAYYRDAKRWVDRPFWKRRSAQLTASAA